MEIMKNGEGIEEKIINGNSYGWADNSWREDKSGEMGTSIIRDYVGEMPGTTILHLLTFPILHPGRETKKMLA